MVNTIPIVIGKNVTKIGKLLVFKGTKKEPWMIPNVKEAKIPSFILPNAFSPFEDATTTRAAIASNKIEMIVIVSFIGLNNQASLKNKSPQRALVIITTGIQRLNALVIPKFFIPTYPNVIPIAQKTPAIKGPMAFAKLIFCTTNKKTMVEISR